MSWLIRLFLAGFCVATLGSIAARDARAETRVALVVGNAGYEHADVLANTVNDAVAVSSVLKKAGFDVDERDNLASSSSSAQFAISRERRRTPISRSSIIPDTEWGLTAEII